jgi:uncharacterized membrane protein
MKKDQNTKKYLVLILILAFSLRMYGLFSEDIWLDESITLWSTSSIDTLVSADDPSPPLHKFVVFSFVKLFGVNKFSLRFPSVIFGVLAVYFCYLVANELFSEKTALFTALFASLSCFQIFHSQNGRPYAMLGFFAMASTYYFLKKNTRNYIIFSILMMYTHIFGGLLLLAHLIISKFKIINHKLSSLFYIFPG